MDNLTFAGCLITGYTKEGKQIYTATIMTLIIYSMKVLEVVVLCLWCTFSTFSYHVKTRWKANAHTNVCANGTTSICLWALPTEAKILEWAVTSL